MFTRISVIMTLIFCFLMPVVPGHTSEFETRTDIPPLGRTDPEQFREFHSAHGGAGSIRYMELLGSDDFETNFLFIHRGVIPPKSSIGEHVHRSMEEMYIVFDSPARFTVNGHTAELPAGAMVLCPMGSSHGIYNHTDREIQWMNIAVGTKKGEFDAIDFNDDLVKAPLENPPVFRWTRLDRSLMHPGGSAHQGKGEILFRRLWNSEAFGTNWYVVSHAVVPPGASIGYHQHNTREEVYYIISGTGRLTANGKTFDVRSGDAVPCRLHGSHGIFNNSSNDLEVLVFSCSVVKGVVTDEKNLGDDLSGR